MEPKLGWAFLCFLYAALQEYKGSKLQEVRMPATEAVPRPVIDQQQVRGSSGDINRRSEELWHLEYPHNKALAALFYTSLLRAAWEIAVHSGGSLSHFCRASNHRALPEKSPENGHVGGL